MATGDHKTYADGLMDGLMNANAPLSSAQMYVRDATGYWQRYPFKTCEICGQPAEQATAELGYPSEFDMGVVCDKCVVKYIDPAIKQAREEFTTDHLTTSTE